jgi:hypothetical protein
LWFTLGLALAKLELGLLISDNNLRISLFDPFFFLSISGGVVLTAWILLDGAERFGILQRKETLVLRVSNVD